ncbi:MAG: glutamate-5-semialdehyde dehydrogenase, partial [Candidatus Promineifilaceae bacterium]|nr:glutamate-5-semialdehyde dehydrogenase [Candidatus Promineifilaceae bacterium]
STRRKNEALEAIARELEAQAGAVLEQNRLDIEDGRANGLSDALLDRLLLTEERVARLAADARRVASLPDPVGAEMDSRLLPNGMRLRKRRIPIGVLGVIYEARPNVTVDIATLSLKTGNAVILRGGSETLRSNLALVNVIQSALEQAALSQAAVQYVGDVDRALVRQLLRLDQYVDMIVPRGGAGLHRLCREQSTIPVITGGIGICHIFVDESADLERAVDVVENAKVQRPSVCNALDTLLVHRNVAADFLPQVAGRLAQHSVELRATEEALPFLSADSAGGNGARIVPAGPDDFDQEWLDLIMGIRLVDGLDDAIAHIHEHSTEHSDSILTNNWERANRFVDEINSAAVYVNASTRFTDGGQFGLGAEVAVSTQKLHARGPMGLEELTTYKWIGIGDGHVRE